MTFDPKSLIHPQDGKIDINAVRARALYLAQRDYAGLNPPRSYIRPQEQNVLVLAQALRSDWRAARGLARDDVTMQHVPEWGMSGDSFVSGHRDPSFGSRNWRV